MPLRCRHSKSTGHLSGLCLFGGGEPFLKVLDAFDFGYGLVFFLLLEVPLHEGVGAVCKADVANDLVQLDPLVEFVLEIMAGCRSFAPCQSQTAITHEQAVCWPTERNTSMLAARTDICRVIPNSQACIGAVRHLRV